MFGVNENVLQDDKTLITVFDSISSMKEKEKLKPGSMIFTLENGTLYIKTDKDDSSKYLKVITVNENNASGNNVAFDFIEVSDMKTSKILSLNNTINTLQSSINNLNKKDEELEKEIKNLDTKTKEDLKYKRDIYVTNKNENLNVNCKENDLWIKF